jgi:hypothetical protein
MATCSPRRSDRLAWSTWTYMSILPFVSRSSSLGGCLAPPALGRTMSKQRRPRSDPHPCTAQATFRFFDLACALTVPFRVQWYWVGSRVARLSAALCGETKAPPEAVLIATTMPWYARSTRALFSSLCTISFSPRKARPMPASSRVESTEKPSGCRKFRHQLSYLARTVHKMGDVSVMILLTHRPAADNK